ncbi:MAG TPA: transcription antitermination factor NusB [Terriglobales bacterium]|nr:transcription antitermination factor NusB [Terriglobales bacterium]
MSTKQRQLPRADARRGALYLVFGYGFQGGDAAQFCQHEREWEPDRYDDYSQRIFLTAVEHRAEIDELIGRHTKNWKLARLSKVSAAVLRVAVCEMLFIDEIDTPIAINEAVELAKEFEGEEGGAFVNGVLGGIARERENG